MEYEVQELDLKELIVLIVSRWYWIVLAVIGGLVFSSVYCFGMLEDVYTAESSMIVLVESEDATQVTNFIYGQKLVDTYTELAKSKQVLDRLDELNLPYSTSQLKSMITLNGVQDTVVLKLRVESTSPEDAALIANETMKAIRELSATYEGFDNIEVMDFASVPSVPSGPNRMLYTAIGIILGGGVGVGLVLLVAFLDTSIRSSKDVEIKLNLRVLGVIPDYIDEVSVNE